MIVIVSAKIGIINGLLLILWLKKQIPELAFVDA